MSWSLPWCTFLRTVRVIFIFHALERSTEQGKIWKQNTQLTPGKGKWHSFQSRRQQPLKSVWNFEGLSVLLDEGDPCFCCINLEPVGKQWDVFYSWNSTPYPHTPKNIHLNCLKFWVFIQSQCVSLRIRHILKLVKYVNV